VLYVPRNLRSRYGRLSRRLREEEGFTLVEAMAAITILSVGAFAAAQALLFGLDSSGLARQRLAARTALNQQMEQARSLNYDNLVLSDPDPGLTHATDANDPDYWVDTDAQTFDPDGAGPLAAESIVRVAGASPSLQHYQNPLHQGNTTYSVYRYVTWVDSPTDGTVAAGTDAADGNNDGADDSAGHDLKRVTLYVTWNDQFGRGVVLSTQMSLFSDGKIAYRSPAMNAPPVVSCPTATYTDDDAEEVPVTVSFTAVATDTDGSVVTATWTFGDAGTGTGLTTTHSYAAYGTYTVVNTVTDNGGGTATNANLACTVSVLDPNVGTGGPDGTVKINNGASDTSSCPSPTNYTKSTVVTLTLSNADNPNTITEMQLSNDGVSWTAKQAYTTSTSWTLVAGDGTKRVYALFYNASGLVGRRACGAITLDTTAPGAPTGLTATAVTVGTNSNVTLTWTAPAGVTDLGGYRVWRRLITSTTWTQVTCSSGTSTTCADTHKRTDSYEYYVEAYDLAGNTGVQSNHVTS
jgi:type II secretory pathway pseudopilin PulG